MDEEFRCRQCNQYYADPVKLLCGHHICHQHIADHSSRSHLNCPFCGEISPLPPDGLQLDRTLQVVTEVWKEVQAAARAVEPGQEQPPRVCGFCEEKPASRRCVQCSGFLCNDCEGRTHSKGLFKSHNVVDLDEAPGGPDFTERMVCDTHTQERLSFYCHDCKRPVCSHCLILGDHKGHQQTPIDQAWQLGKDQLGTWQAKLQRRIQTTEELVEQLLGAEQEVARNAEAQRATINNEIDHLRELLETKRQQLLSKSALEEKQKRTALQGQLERADQAKQQAVALVRRSEELLQLSSEHAFLTIVQPLLQDAKMCLNRPVDTAPSVSCTFRPLSTDAQVRCLGDLDLGHAPHPGTVLPGHAPRHSQLAGGPMQVQPMHPGSVVGGGGMMAGMELQHPGFAMPPPGYSMPGAATHSFLQQHPQTVPVQIVYRSVQAQ